MRRSVGCLTSFPLPAQPARVASGRLPGSDWRQFPSGWRRCEQQRLLASQTVGGAAQVEDLAVVEQAVDDGHHEGRVTADDLPPIGQTFVGRDSVESEVNKRASLLAIDLGT